MKALVIDLTHGGITISIELSNLGFSEIYAYDIYNTLNENEKFQIESNNIILLKNLEEFKKINKNIDSNEEKALLEPYYYVPGYKTPRYYQRIAINRTVDAVASGKDRALLVCATGTGKTFMAFQIIYRLWKAGIKKKILFLADRNVLIDQTISGDFKPFGGKMTKVTNKKLDSSYEIYLALYQQLSGDDGEETYLQFQPNFFDLIVIDDDRVIIRTS